MLIAIDHGNYAIKTPHFSFISGLTEHTVKPPMAEEVLEYNGKYWSLTGQRLPYMRDKTRDDRYFILSLFAIAKELSAAGANTAFEQIDIAVGLPPEHYGMLRERFAQLHAKDILGKLRELQVDLRTNPAIFIGGGSVLFRPLIEHTPLVAKATFIEDPKANAIGYEMLARGQMAMRAVQ